jgi:hypothetical protein
MKPGFSAVAVTKAAATSSENRRERKERLESINQI